MGNDAHTADDGTAPLRRVGVTGTGVYSAIGSSPDALAESLQAGRSGVRPIELMDSDFLPVSHAAEIPNYTPEEHFSTREIWKIDRSTQLAILAARQAVDRAGMDLENLDPTRVALTVGMAGSIQYENLPVTLDRTLQPTRQAARFFARSVPRMQTAVLAEHLGVEGPQITFSIASAAGGLAVEQALNLLRSGRADVVLAGGGEVLSILNAVGMGALGVVADGTSSPFSGEPGISFGEAAGFLVLESLEHARRRGAEVLAEVRAASVTADAYDPISNDPSGSGLHRAMHRAVEAAGWTADAVDWIKASGTGNRQQDLLESGAIQALYDQSDADPPPASSLESAYGHANGISPTLGLIAAVEAHRRGFLPPTANFQDPRSGCTLDYVPNEARRADVDRFLVNGIAFGGVNSVIAGGAPSDVSPPAVRPEDEVLITGCGLVSPIGHGLDTFTGALREGTCGLQPVDAVDPENVRATRAGTVDLNSRSLVPTLRTRRLNPMSTYALTAAALALDDAGLQQGGPDGDRMGVLAGQSRGPIDAFQKLLTSLFSGRRSGMVGKLLLEMGRFSIATRVADTFDLRGYAGSMDQGITSGLHALAVGTEHLRRHPHLDALVVVSADAFGDLFYRLYDKAGVLAPDGFVPYGPGGEADAAAFGLAGSGMALAEGAAALVLERRRRAESRDARPRARVSGVALSGDARGPFRFHPEAPSLHRAATDALSDALSDAQADASSTDASSTDASSIDAVYGHGRGAAAYDRSEARALGRLFDAPVPAGCVNGHTGVAEAASGLFSVAAALGSLQHNEVYPLLSDGPRADTGPLDFADAVRPVDVHRALVAGATESGAAAAVVLDAP